MLTYPFGRRNNKYPYPSRLSLVYEFLNPKTKPFRIPSRLLTSAYTGQRAPDEKVDEAEGGEREFLPKISSKNLIITFTSLESSLCTEERGKKREREDEPERGGRASNVKMYMHDIRNETEDPSSHPAEIHPFPPLSSSLHLLTPNMETFPLFSHFTESDLRKTSLFFTLQKKGKTEWNGNGKGERQSVRRITLLL